MGSTPTQIGPDSVTRRKAAEIRRQLLPDRHAVVHVRRKAHKRVDPILAEIERGLSEGTTITGTYTFSHDALPRGGFVLDLWIVPDAEMVRVSAIASLEPDGYPGRYVVADPMSASGSVVIAPRFRGYVGGSVSDYR